MTNPSLPLRLRFWILLLMRACSTQGLTPISKSTLHQLALVANALSPLYAVASHITYTVNYDRGPFLPLLQRQIDRLVGTGLVTMRAPQYIYDSRGVWFNCLYEETERGRALSGHVAALPLLSEQLVLLQELASSFAAVRTDRRGTLGRHDLAYSGRGRMVDSFVPLNMDESSDSADAAELIARFAQPAHLSQREKLRLYVGYLDREAAPT